MIGPIRIHLEILPLIRTDSHGRRSDYTDQRSDAWSDRSTWDWTGYPDADPYDTIGPDDIYLTAFVWSRLAPFPPDLCQTIRSNGTLSVLCEYKALGLKALALCRRVGPDRMGLYYMIYPKPLSSDPYPTHGSSPDGSEPSGRRSDLPPKTRRF